MAHYSSRLNCYEDGDKLSLKSTPMKPLVFASDAQLGVNAGDERLWAGCNGIYFETHNLRRPNYVIGLYGYSDGLIMG